MLIDSDTANWQLQNVSNHGRNYVCHTLAKYRWFQRNTQLLCDVSRGLWKHSREAGSPRQKHEYTCETLGILGQVHVLYFKSHVAVCVTQLNTSGAPFLTRLDPLFPSELPKFFTAQTEQNAGIIPQRLWSMLIWKHHRLDPYLSAAHPWCECPVKPRLVRSGDRGGRLSAANSSPCSWNQLWIWGLRRGALSC